MLKSKNFRSYLRAAAALPFAMAALAAGHVSPALAAKSYKVLYTFQGTTDGGLPHANLIADSSGNLYGTTASGGSNGTGAVFRLAPDGTESVLHSFAGGSDGSQPYAGLIMDKAGNLYGTTPWGGTNGDGTVFEIASDGTETVIYNFAGGNDGQAPFGRLIEDKAGNLYGTTEIGGGGSGVGGTVFELKKSKSGAYAESILHSFGNSTDGSGPLAGLIEDKSGNFYGTTESGGDFGHGTVFRLAPDGTETVLYSFAGRNDGANPQAALIEDNAGNLYGTTADGITTAYNGTVFKLAPDGTETVIYTFVGGNDGSQPNELIADKKGDLYGTTSYGGSTGCGGNGCGAIFKVKPNGKETVLYSFAGGKNGSYPFAGLINGTSNGKTALFGTAYAGGNGNGVIFKIKE